VQRLDVEIEPAGGERIQGGCKQLDVVAVRAVDGPPDRDAGCFGRDRPLPALLGPVGGVGAGALTATGGLVQAAVDRDLRQIQAADPVVTGDRLVHERVEHAGGDPLVTATTQRGLPDPDQPACVHP
jgi:hypothetical protein